VNFLMVSAVSLASVLVLFGVTFTVGRRIGRYNVVDVAWGPGFVVVAAVAAAVGHGDLTRRLLMLILVAVWGLRLAWHIRAKTAGRGEDPRYRALLHGDESAANVLRKVFVVQGASLWFVSLPVQLSATTGPTPAVLLPVLVLGVVMWLTGLVFAFATWAVLTRALRRTCRRRGAVVVTPTIVPRRVGRAPGPPASATRRP